MGRQRLQNLRNTLRTAQVAYAAYLDMEDDEDDVERRCWVRELNLQRDSEGFFVTSFEKMKDNDPKEFFRITRMSPPTFQLLQQLIEPHLEKSSWRQPIDPTQRLFLVLLYLSQGVPKYVLGWMFRLGHSTVHGIIYETCDVLWKTLMPLYLSPPTTTDWQQIAADFSSIWNLPNCVGAIDGKHINIIRPPGAGSQYYNYKGHHSIVLLATCDAKYAFTSVEIGAYGSQSDGGIIYESAFGRKLFAEDLGFPRPKKLPNSNFICKHYLVGDAAFPLKTFLMRPYPGQHMENEKFYFNQRLSRARRVIENTFGILVARWRILSTTLNMLPQNADKIVKAAVVLHNFVKLNELAYCTPEYVDLTNANDEVVAEGTWRTEVKSLHSCRAIKTRNSPAAAFEMRDQLKTYLNQNKI